MERNILKSPGDWLKECLRILFDLLKGPETQMLPQSLEILPNGSGQKAFSSDVASREREMAEETFSSSYCQKYFEYLANRALDFGVLNTKAPFAVMLEDVFVEPNITQALPFVKQEVSRNVATRRFPVSIWEFLARHHALVILGPPGSGKTSLLLHITQTLMDAQKRSDNHTLNKLPILLFLRHHSEMINKYPSYTLVEAVQYSHNTSQIASLVPVDWFEKTLRQGQCLVMLDGLNEVPESLRKQVVMWIEQQMQFYGKNHFVVTSRLVGYRHSLRRMMALEIQPFSNEQVQHFVARWYLANQINRGKENYARTKQEVEELSRLCCEPTFSLLVVNPLLLTMMTMQFPYNASLPHSSVDLYRETIELFLSSEKYGEEFNLTPAQKRRVLQPLADYMMQHNQLEIDFDEAQRVLYVPLDMVSRNPKVAEFLQMITKESGLLRENNGQYSFAHLCLQEYLASLHQKKVHHFVLQIASSWWHETIRLYCMESDTTEIMSACLSQKNSLPALQLAIRCAQESPQVKSSLVHQLESILALEVDAADAVRRRIVADALLALRLKGMMRVHDNLYVAEWLITNAEYRLFIEEQRVGKSHLEEQFKKPFLARSGQKAVTDVQPSDAVAFCQWLTKRDQSGFRYRLPYSGEFSPLISEIAYWTQQKTKKAYELEKEQRAELSLRTLESRLRSLIARDIAHNPESALARLYQLEDALEKAFERQSQYDGAYALALARDFVHDRAHARVLNEEQKAGRLEDGKESAWYSYFMAWLVTQKLLTLLREQPKPRSWLKGFDRHGIIVPPIEQKVLAEEYFKLYTDLANLEERSLGKWLTARGIRIVAERRTGQEAYKRKVLQKKICLLGNEAVGKTSLVRRFVKESFDKKYLSTMGVSISEKTVERATYTMNMQIWDLEGGKGFKKMHLNYLRGAAGALIVCDLARHETLAAFERYARQLRTLNPTVPIVFVGNKVDLNNREITGQDLELLCTTLDGPYLLTSAKTGTQVEDAFSLLADLIERL